MSNKPGYSLTHEDMEKLWNSSSDEGKRYLFSTFGVKKETFLPDIMERVYDVGSAIREMKRRKNGFPFYTEHPKVRVFQKLSGVAEALNEECPEEEKVWLPPLYIPGNPNNCLIAIDTSKLNLPISIKQGSSAIIASQIARMHIALSRPLMVRSEKLAMYFFRKFEPDWRTIYS